MSLHQNPTQAELDELAALFETGIAIETGDILPLPSMPLLAPPPSPDDATAAATAEAVDQGLIQIGETGEQSRRIPQFDELKRGMSIELPDGTVEVLRDIDPRTKRVAFGPKKRRRWYGLEEVKLVDTSKLAKKIKETETRERKEYDLPPDPEPVKLPKNIPEGLFPWQIENARFIETHGSGLIADEMGLGKSISAAICIKAPAIVVCPALLKVNWARELNRWRPDLSVAIISGSEKTLKTEVKLGKTAKKLRGSKDAELAAAADVVVINYDILSSHVEWLKDRGNQTLIADEAHYLKSLQTSWKNRQWVASKGAQRAKSFFELRQGIERLILLTGTPILNRVIELWPLLHLLDPSRATDDGRSGGFSSRSKFCWRYCQGRHDFIRTRVGTQEVLNCDGRSNTQELHQRLVEKYMIRHTKLAMLPMLPEKQRRTQLCSLSPETARQYRRAQDDFLMWVAEQGGPEAVARAQQAQALVKLTKLRALSALGKAPFMVQYITNWFQSTQRPLVVMGQHAQAFDAIEEGLEEVNASVRERKKGGKMGVVDRAIRYAKVVGGMSAAKRQAAIDNFQNGHLDVILYSIPIATGTTLTRASDVVFFERAWRPADNLQAEDRVHRIGQTNQVTVTYIDAEGTLDAAMGNLLKDKTSAAVSVIDGIELESDEAAMLVFGEMWGTVLGASGPLTLSIEELDEAVREGHRQAEEEMKGVKKNPAPRLLDEDGEWIDSYDDESDDDEE